MTQTLLSNANERPSTESGVHWLSRLYHGASCLSSGLLIGFFLDGKKLPLIGPLIDLLPNVLVFIGLWFLASPEPGSDANGTDLRKLIRGLAIIAFLVDIALAVLGIFPSVELVHVRGISVALGSLLFILVAFYLARLADRIPDAQLAGRLRWVLPSLAITSGLTFGIVLYSPVFLGEVPLQRWMDGGIISRNIVVFAAFIFIILSIVLVFWSVGLIHRFGQIASQQAEQARIENDNRH